jgi:hypothetical protein
MRKNTGASLRGLTTGNFFRREVGIWNSGTHEREMLAGFQPLNRVRPPAEVNSEFPFFAAAR